jgi:hypothetical protein
LSSFFAGSFLVLYFGLDIGAGPIVWAATAIHPNPRLVGTGTLGQASVEMWQRGMEFNVFLPIKQTFLHSSELFTARPQVAEFAEVCSQKAYQGLEWLDSVLATRRYFAGGVYHYRRHYSSCGHGFHKLSSRGKI